jgi:hypothetical protein
MLINNTHKYDILQNQIILLGTTIAYETTRLRIGENSIIDWFAVIM